MNPTKMPTSKDKGLRRQEPVQMFQKNRESLRRYGSTPAMPMSPMKGS